MVQGSAIDRGCCVKFSNGARDADVIPAMVPWLLAPSLCIGGMSATAKFSNGVMDVDAELSIGAMDAGVI